jgi:hypothetical protein
MQRSRQGGAKFKRNYATLQHKRTRKALMKNAEKKRREALIPFYIQQAKEKKAAKQFNNMNSLFGKMNMGRKVTNSTHTIKKTRSRAAPRASRKVSQFAATPAQLDPTRKSYSRKSRSERALNRSMGKMGD